MGIASAEDRRADEGSRLRAIIVGVSEKLLLLEP
jgi:hypothetical protein